MKARGIPVLSLMLFAAGCAGRGGAVPAPDDVRRYEILVPGRDSLSRAFAGALANEGFHVRSRVRGGNRPTAVLVHFVYSEPNGPTMLHSRLANTRNGLIVAEAMVPIDTTRRAALDSVLVLVRALSAKAK